MKRKLSTFTTLLVTLLLLAIWYASGIPVAGTAPLCPFLSGLTAVAIILANAFLLYLTENRIMIHTGLFTPVAYIVLATANPTALWFSPFHGATLLLAVSMFFYLDFCAVGPSMGKLVGAWATLGAATLLFPPSLWLAPVYAITSFGKTEEKLKCCVASLLAVSLPFGLYIGVESLLTGGGTAGSFLAGLWERMTTLPRLSPHFSTATLIRIILTALATLLALIQSFRQIGHYKIARFAAVRRIMLLTLSIALLMLLFLPNGRYPAGLVTSLPIALLLNEYFDVRDEKKGMWSFAVILVLILVAERIARYL